MPGELAYAATKGAVDALARSLSATIASLGITVNAVDPGATDTGCDYPRNLRPNGRPSHRWRDRLGRRGFQFGSGNLGFPRGEEWINRQSSPAWRGLAVERPRETFK